MTLHLVQSRHPGLHLLLAASLLHCAANYKCLRPSLCVLLSPNMASSDHNIWFSEQPPFFSSLDTMITSESSDTFDSRLPPIPEENWDFGWDEHMFNLPDPYEGFEQTSTTAVEHANNDNTPPQAHEELIKLQNEV